jgi:poly-beta-1,6-N-acetyl-D-glucosamine biosynthesis protein PgaD
MGKPGPRNSYTKIIDKPELKSPLRNLMEGSVTVFLWAVWVYWMIPLVTIFLWIFGVRMFYRSILSQVNSSELLGILHNGGITILVIVTLNLVWINYNYYMIFKRLGNRRKEGGKCSETKLAEFFNADPTQVEEAKKKNRLEVTLEGKKITINSAS